MEPAKTYTIRTQFPNTAITISKGHRIRLIVTSSSSPKYAVNNNNGGPMYNGGPGGRAAANRIYCDHGRPSELVVPVED